MQPNIPTLRWKSVNYEIAVQAPVGDFTRARRLNYDEPAPPEGTEISRGLLRAFVPDKYIKVGDVKFKSGSMFSPFNKLDLSNINGDLLSCDPSNSNQELYVFRGDPSECHALLQKINDNKDLTGKSTAEGLKTVGYNSALTAGPLSGIFILAGTMLGGPAGGAIGGATATAIGLIVGTTTGVMQAIALDKASRDEEALKAALRAWLMYTDPSPINGGVNTIAAKELLQALSEQGRFKKTDPVTIQYVILQCFIKQIDRRLAAGLVMTEQAINIERMRHQNEGALEAVGTSTGIQLSPNIQVGQSSRNGEADSSQLRIMPRRTQE